VPLDNAAMVVGATALIAQFNVMKLHSAPAGSLGTSNLTTAGSQTVSWTAPTGLGNFGLASPVNFTGGAPSGSVYSFSLWSTGGTFWGEFPMSSTADPQFNGLGQYSVNAADFTGTAS
jgi:hypothetical protein